MSVSTEIEKIFDKFKYSFMVNTLSKWEIEQKLPQLDKTHVHKGTDNILLTGEKLGVFFLRWGARQGYGLTTLL